MTTARPLSARPTPARDTGVELFSVAGHDGYLREVNDRFAHLLGVDPSDLNDHSILEWVHPDDLTSIVAGLAALEAGAGEVLFENRFRRHDGGWIHLQWVARPLPGTELWWAAGRDTTAFHRLTAHSVDLRARLDLAVGTDTAAMWEYDCRTGVFSWEPQATVVLDVAVGELPVGVAELRALVHDADADTVTVGVDSLVATGAVDVAVRIGAGDQLRHLSLRGKVSDRDRRGRPLRAVGLLLNVTAEKAMEEQLLRMIMSDALTGAPNRRAFDQTLRTGWRRCAGTGAPLSIVMIDIDDFKKFNDTFSHLVGDEVMCTVWRALNDNLRHNDDTVARFGGEEFAVVLPDVDTAGAAIVAQRLCEAVREVTIRQAPGWTLSVSVGTATAQPDQRIVKSPELLAHADEALYAAKAAGKNRVVGYEHALAARADLETAIRRGLADGEFVLYYQPIIDLHTGDVAGFEALIRWNRPGHGLVPPDAFIPIAETSTLICDLGRWALHTATTQLRSWMDSGLDRGGPLRIAVNASGRHIADPDIVTDVAAALNSSQLPADRLELELTETALVDGDLVAAHLAQVRALGATVSIDDFGTGYTAIGQLPTLPADTLKIDRSFIAATDPRQRELVVLMIAAAHAFNLRVVAEGIEDCDILHALRNLGCDDAQGYLLATPMPAHRVPAWLDAWPTHRATILPAATPSAQTPAPARRQ